MYRIVATEVPTPNSKLFTIDAPRIARRAKAGQFVVIRVSEAGERIPLTIADHDPENGTITIIVQAIGKTTRKLSELNAGDSVADVVGPLGLATEIEKYGTVLCIGGGFGMAAMFPVAQAFKEAGNKLIAVIGARNESLLLWEDRMREIADEMLITTDDGSKGRKGMVIDALKDVLAEGRKLDLVVAVGPVIMMRAVANITRPYGVKTMVSLNPIMIDGTGMCGGCRVTVGGEQRFVCVHGPDFDGHEVAWDELMARLTIYQPEEKVALEKYQCEACKSA
ncbi:MAG: sulfide/dihydroorotate dehydrogenase-like FAD/NAD-binding protein [Dehalococcoidales bacterium]|nr:sulfide/dihydroorotate dehydrogenase-like FAD/NAD-binding protein [Dehalococcoidales bacterium]